MSNHSEDTSKDIFKNESLQPSGFALHVVLVDHVGNSIPSQLQEAFNACDVFIPEALTRGPKDEEGLQNMAKSSSPMPSNLPIRFHFVRKLGEMITGSGKIIKLIDPIGGNNPFEVYNKEANRLVRALATYGKITQVGIDVMTRQFEIAVSTLAQTQNGREEGMVKNLVTVLEQLAPSRRDTQQSPLKIVCMLGRYHRSFIEKVTNNPLLQDLPLTSEVVNEGIRLVETPFAQLLNLCKEEKIETLSEEEKQLLVNQAFLQAVIEGSILYWADTARLDRDRNYYLRNVLLLNAVCRSFTTSEEIVQMLIADSANERIKKLGDALKDLLNNPQKETHQLFVDVQKTK